MVLNNAVNEYDTPVTQMTCTTCGHEFTVCPPVEPGEWGSQCLGEHCASYDLDRDVDLFFNALSEAGQVVRS